MIKGSLESAAKAREEMLKLQSDNEAILRKAREEREDILKEAREVRDKLISEAREKQLKRLKNLLKKQEQELKVKSEKLFLKFVSRLQLFQLRLLQKLLGKNSNNRRTGKTDR